VIINAPFNRTKEEKRGRVFPWIFIESLVD
jgi:hypothetical protein